MVHFTIKAHRAKDIAATEWIEKKTEELSNASNTKVSPSKILFQEAAPTPQPTQVQPLNPKEYGNLKAWKAPKKTTQTPVFNMFDDDGTESKTKNADEAEWMEQRTDNLLNASNTKVLPSKALFKEVAPTPTQVRPLNPEEYGNLQEAPKKTTQTPVFNMFDDDGTESNVNFADETVLKKQAAEWF